MRPSAPNAPDHNKPPSRLERIAAAAEHITVALQLLAGAVIVILLNVNYYQDIRNGAWYNPPWLSFAIPVVLTSIWLLIATWSVRHLWRVWQAHRAWKAWEKRQRALSATSPLSQPPMQPMQSPQPEATLPPPPPLP